MKFLVFFISNTVKATITAAVGELFFYNTPMISARFHACEAGLQLRFSKGVSTN